MVLAEGRARVERGTGLLARLAGAIVGFPGPAADTPVSVRFERDGAAEIWTRRFGAASFSSRQFAGTGRHAGLLRESFGPLTFAMALVPEGNRLALAFQGWRCLGVPLPPWLAPRSRAFEAETDGRFHFHVEIWHVLTGPIVLYEGWLVPVEPAARGV